LFNAGVIHGIVNEDLKEVKNQDAIIDENEVLPSNLKFNISDLK
jgi:hypothetical protein